MDIKEICNTWKAVKGFHEMNSNRICIETVNEPIIDSSKNKILSIYTLSQLSIDMFQMLFNYNNFDIVSIKFPMNMQEGYTERDMYIEFKFKDTYRYIETFFIHFTVTNKIFDRNEKFWKVVIDANTNKCLEKEVTTIRQLNLLPNSVKQELLEVLTEEYFKCYKVLYYNFNKTNSSKLEDLKNNTRNYSEEKVVVKDEPEKDIKSDNDKTAYQFSKWSNIINNPNSTLKEIKEAALRKGVSLEIVMDGVAFSI